MDYANKMAFIIFYTLYGVSFFLITIQLHKIFSLIEKKAAAFFPK